LSAAARTLWEVALPWELQVGAPTSERSYELLVRSPGIEVWLIHWPCGGRLQLHDHGGASGAFRVVSGELRETYVDARCRLAQRRVGPGRGVAFGPGYVHDVENTEEEGATSIHVYAPPSDRMFFYRYEGPGQLVRVGSAPFEEAESVSPPLFGANGGLHHEYLTSQG
jgi:mannose-6-phosphate isomerase-like protein (cupin superfamily)